MVRNTEQPSKSVLFLLCVVVHSKNGRFGVCFGGWEIEQSFRFRKLLNFSTIYLQNFVNI